MHTYSHLNMTHLSFNQTIAHSSETMKHMEKYRRALDVMEMEPSIYKGEDLEMTAEEANKNREGADVRYKM